MSNSTKDDSLNGGIGGPTIEDPHAHLELTEDELNEIYSRPYMNPEHVQYGCNPNSNQVLDAEKALIEAKQEKCIELVKQNGEIFAILEQAKTDKHVLQMTGGREIDLNSVTNLLFSDQHFLNRKYTTTSSLTSITRAACLYGDSLG